MNKIKRTYDELTGYVLPKDEKERYIHIYYSDFRKAKERTKLQTAIREQKEYLESLRGSDAKIDAIGTEHFLSFQRTVSHRLYSV